MKNKERVNVTYWRVVNDVYSNLLFKLSTERFQAEYNRTSIISNTKQRSSRCFSEDQTRIKQWFHAWCGGEKASTKMNARPTIYSNKLGFNLLQFQVGFDWKMAIRIQNLSMWFLVGEFKSILTELKKRDVDERRASDFFPIGKYEYCTKTERVISFLCWNCWTYERASYFLVQKMD